MLHSPHGKARPRPIRKRRLPRYRRGNERRDIYRDVADRKRFLETLEEAVERFGVVVHACCLMDNRYHLLLQTPHANLSDSAGWLQATYSSRFNHRHRRSGHLFHGRFKAHLVEADSYARQLIKYIHLNPVRPKEKRRPVPVKRCGQLSRYRWSSHRVYAGVGNTSPPHWLCTEWLSYFGRTHEIAQREYRAQIARMFGQVIRSPWRDLRGRLVLGSERLWNKACGLVAQSEGDEEIRWSRRVAAEAVAAEVERLAAAQSDRRIAIWLHVRHGGRRMTEVARQFGYRDGRKYGFLSSVAKRLQLLERYALWHVHEQRRGNRTLLPTALRTLPSDEPESTRCRAKFTAGRPASVAQPPVNLVVPLGPLPSSPASPHRIFSARRSFFLLTNR